jgi:hypothetical protein
VEGPVQGFISAASGIPIADQVADAMTIRAHPVRVCRLIFGTHNIPVLVSNMSPIIASDATPWRMAHRVSFTVVQVGEFPARIS